MRRISIIVPNYNSASYITECLNSIISQKYKNKEVIIVDDGSTDSSIEIIRKIIDSNKDIEMKLICQSNLNAAMARNRAMKMATGDYVLFLDSDDALEEDILSKLIAAYRENDVDLVFGNYEKVNKNDQIIQKRTFTNKNVIWDVRDKFAELVSFDPVPTNKLYDLNLIRKNGLEWGNVRIGQDLNFYLKYIALCRRVLMIKESVYRYCVGGANSISNSYDLRIFDIVNVFDDVKNFYEMKGLTRLYAEYMPILALKHYNSQMSKLVNFGDRKIRKIIIDYFAVSEREIDYSACRNMAKSLKIMRRKFRLKCLLSGIVSLSFYRRYKLKKARQ